MTKDEALELLKPMIEDLEKLIDCMERQVLGIGFDNGQQFEFSLDELRALREKKV